MCGEYGLFNGVDWWFILMIGVGDVVEVFLRDLLCLGIIFCVVGFFDDNF